MSDPTSRMALSDFIHSKPRQLGVRVGLTNQNGLTHTALIAFVVAVGAAIRVIHVDAQLVAATVQGQQLVQLSIERLTYRHVQPAREAALKARVSVAGTQAHPPLDALSSTNGEP